jgi:hypothetical protein
MLSTLLGRYPVRLAIIKWTPIVLGIIVAFLQAGILYTMKRKNLRSQFPIFFSYNVYVIAAVFLGFIPYLFCCSYPNLHYLFDALSVILIGIEFALMYEIFVAALKPYSALIDLGKMLFRWAGVFLLTAAVLTAIATASPSVSRISVAIELLERSMRLMECGFLLLFLLFERKLGLSWRSASMSIALGLGMTAASGLAVTYLQNKFPDQAPILWIVENLFYFGAVVFWLACLAMPAPERQNVLDSPSRLIFQRWNDVLVTSRFSPSPVASIGSIDSFLPNVEQTVDRVLARKMVQ